MADLHEWCAGFSSHRSRLPVTQPDTAEDLGLDDETGEVVEQKSEKGNNRRLLSLAARSPETKTGRNIFACTSKTGESPSQIEKGVSEAKRQVIYTGLRELDLQLINLQQGKLQLHHTEAKPHNFVSSTLLEYDNNPMSVSFRPINKTRHSNKMSNKT